MAEEPLVGASRLAHHTAQFWVTLHRQWRRYTTSRPAVARVLAQLALPVLDWLHHQAKRADPLYAYVHSAPLQSELPSEPANSWWRSVVTPRFALVLFVGCVLVASRAWLDSAILRRAAGLRRRRDRHSSDAAAS